MCIQACALNGIDHRPGGDGGAGELVKIAAIFFDRPMAVALTVDDFPGKMGDPVRQAKLDFIAQEMNREANTILSKSTDLEISDRAILLKTEVEKVREQIQNIE